MNLSTRSTVFEAPITSAVHLGMINRTAFCRTCSKEFRFLDMIVRGNVAIRMSDPKYNARCKPCDAARQERLAGRSQPTQTS